MKGVILDKASFDRGDVNLRPLRQPAVDWTDYAGTSPDQTGQRISGCGIIITNKVVLNRALLESAHCLKLIMIAATGTDNVDLDICRERGITVCNVRHYATPAVVQHTFALMLNLLTSQIRYVRDVRAGCWSRSQVFCLLDHPIVEIQGKTLGILGYGALGKSVAEIARAFAMEVKIWQRPGGRPATARVPFEQLLRQADILSIHCPLTPDTTGLLGAAEFEKMKSSAFVINTARGAIIDSDALVDALRAGRIAGAGIDVLHREPPDCAHPLLQKDIPNLIVTPHNAWASQETRQRLVDRLGENLAGWLHGKPVNVVS